MDQLGAALADLADQVNISPGSQQQPVQRLRRGADVVFQ